MCVCILASFTTEESAGWVIGGPIVDSIDLESMAIVGAELREIYPPPYLIAFPLEMSQYFTLLRKTQGFNFQNLTGVI